MASRVSAADTVAVGEDLSALGVDQHRAERLVARVHGAAGRFDETAPLPLRRTDRDTTERIDIAAAGWGEDRASRRSIVSPFATLARPSARTLSSPAPISPSSA